MTNWSDFKILDPTLDLHTAVEYNGGPWKRLCQEYCWENNLFLFTWWPPESDMYSGPFHLGMLQPGLHACLGTRVYIVTNSGADFIGSAATWKTACKILARWDNGEIEARSLDAEP